MLQGTAAANTEMGATRLNAGRCRLVDLGHPRQLKVGLATVTQPADLLTGQSALDKNRFTAVAGDPLTGMVQRFDNSGIHDDLTSIGATRA